MPASVDWGSVPEWFAAIGTVGALFVALILLRNELADRRRAAEVGDHRPADGVFAWAEPRTDAGGWQTFVLNRSDEPIYDAVVYFIPLTDPPLPTQESVWGTVPPGGPKPGDSYGDRPAISLVFHPWRSSSRMVEDDTGVVVPGGGCRSWTRDIRSTERILLTDLLTDGPALGVIHRYQPSRRFRESPGSGHY